MERSAQTCGKRGIQCYYHLGYVEICRNSGGGSCNSLIFCCKYTDLSYETLSYPRIEYCLDGSTSTCNDCRTSHWKKDRRFLSDSWRNYAVCHSACWISVCSYTAHHGRERIRRRERQENAMESCGSAFVWRCIVLLLLSFEWIRITAGHRSDRLVTLFIEV